MFASLVVALDGSECAHRAFDLALHIAKAEGSKLSICSVADPSAIYGTLEPLVIVERALDQIHDNAQRVVDEAAAKAAAAGVPAQGCVLEGDPAYEIVLYAGKIGADAIVIGTHGRSGLRRLLMGSVAEGVLRHSTAPVIVAREGARVGEPAGKSDVEKILVPDDGSETSVRALDIATDFAASTNAELVICHVVNLADVALLSGGEAQLMPGCLLELESNAKAILNEAITRVGSRVRATCRCAEGEPIAEIERLIAEIRPDFIVMGSHGRGGLGRVVMGSVAEGVVRAAPVPVMVVPARSG